MHNVKLEYFKSKLLEEREQVVKSLKNRGERESETREQLNSELSSYDNHPGDTGTETYMIEQEKGFKKQLEDTIEKIDESLEDIKSGRYGYCDNCDKEISEGRLELIPYAKSCLECSDEEIEDEADLEFETRDDERLGYKTNTSKINMGYDREDVYRDTMQDNIVPNDPSYSTGDNMGISEEKEDFEITDEIQSLSYEGIEDDLT